jgi:predicted sulfurtransferase
MDAAVVETTQVVKREAPAEQVITDAMPAEVVVVLYYLYHPVDDPAALCDRQIALGARLRLTGRVRVAAEGINGTVCGAAQDVEEYNEVLSTEFAPSRIDFKLGCSGAAFEEFRVRRVQQICTLGDVNYDLARRGTKVSPQQFHSMLEESDDALLVLDVRNAYESNIGRFRGAVRPALRKFSEFPAWLRANAGALMGKRVAMYCTGGIRCEAASAYVAEHAAPAAVYQLEGGIHRYLETFASGGRFDGKNFVFDQVSFYVPLHLTRIMLTI